MLLPLLPSSPPPLLPSSPAHLPSSPPKVFGVEVSSALSLGVIVATLGGGVGLSLLAAEEEKEAYDPSSPQSMGLKVLKKLTGGGE